MSDSDYRTLLKTAIKLNHWDGTLQGMYDIWNSLGLGDIAIEDNQDMSLAVIVTSSLLGLVPYFLYYLLPRPAGVKINYYITGAPAGQPGFGFDMDNSFLSGFDSGYWMIQVLK
jgi:hypothetical protein